MWPARARQVDYRFVCLPVPRGSHLGLNSCDSRHAFRASRKLFAAFDWLWRYKLWWSIIALRLSWRISCFHCGKMQFFFKFLVSDAQLNFCPMKSVAWPLYIKLIFYLFLHAIPDDITLKLVELFLAHFGLVISSKDNTSKSLRKTRDVQYVTFNLQRLNFLLIQCTWSVQIYSAHRFRWRIWKDTNCCVVLLLQDNLMFII